MYERLSDEAAYGLLCISCENCDGVIDDDQLCTTAIGRRLVLERARHAFVDEVAHVAKRTLHERHDDATSFHSKLLLRLSFLRGDGSFRAYQCTRCGYGPILHADCSDLSSHHGQITHDARISNACPRCEHFASNIFELRQWTGSYERHEAP